MSVESWIYQKYIQSDKEIAEIKKLGLDPVRNLTNDGMAKVLDADGYLIALVACRSTFKRGQGHLSECSERDANARSIADSQMTTWCLKQIIDSLPAKRDWLDPEVERAARKLLKDSK